jgi:hypothetical protein
MMAHTSVIPAKSLPPAKAGAGIQERGFSCATRWIPAFAGMTAGDVLND